MPRSSRRKARIAALQILYCRSKYKYIEEAEILIVKDSKLSGEYRKFARSLIDTTWRNLEEIDRSIAGNLKNWKQTRLSETLNALLRIGACELIYFPQTDAKVVFNESLELCKRFVGEKATKLCNGVLHAIWQEWNGKAQRPDSPSTCNSFPIQ